MGLPYNSYNPITNTAWVRARLCKLQKGCTRLATTSDKVYQLLAYGRWLSLGTPASSTTKTGRHSIAEILMKVALSTINQIKSIKIFSYYSIENITPSCYRDLQQILELKMNLHSFIMNTLYIVFPLKK